MNKRIEKKLSKGIKMKCQRFRTSAIAEPLNRAEKRFVNRYKCTHLSRIDGRNVLDCSKVLEDNPILEETWEERVNRIDSYKFANPTPIKVHKSPTVWERLKDKIGGWLR